MHDHLISSQPKQDIASPKREVAYTIQLRYSLQTENVIVCFDIGKNKQKQILIVFVIGMLHAQNKLFFEHKYIPTHTCTDSLQYFEKCSLDPVWLLFSGLAINMCLLNKE